MPKQLYTCGHCGRTFEDYASNRTKGDMHYCSRRCKGQAQTAMALAAAPTKMGAARKRGEKAARALTMRM